MSAYCSRDDVWAVTGDLSKIDKYVDDEIDRLINWASKVIIEDLGEFDPIPDTVAEATALHVAIRYYNRPSMRRGMSTGRTQAVIDDISNSIREWKERLKELYEKIKGIGFVSASTEYAGDSESPIVEETET